MVKLNIRKDDVVKVIAGRDKGKQGKVLRVFPAEGKLLVEQVMMIKRHTKANPNARVKGGIMHHEAPIQASNVRLVCPECGPTRVHRVLPTAAAGEKVKSFRECLKCKRQMD